MDRGQGKKCAEYLIENYLKLNQESLLIFDDLLKLGFASAVGKGVAFLDPQYELCY